MNFEWEDESMLACQECFNEIPPEERLYMTHYELAKCTEITDVAQWKAFLSDTRVSDWFRQEMNIIKETQTRKLISDSTKNDKSVGAAQMINALTKISDGGSTKEGPVFIYCYTPIHKREEGLNNIVTQPYDVFQKEDPN